MVWRLGSIDLIGWLMGWLIGGPRERRREARERTAGVLERPAGARHLVLLCGAVPAGRAGGRGSAHAEGVRRARERRREAREAQVDRAIGCARRWEAGGAEAK